MPMKSVRTMSPSVAGWVVPMRRSRLSWPVRKTSAIVTVGPIADADGRRVRVRVARPK
jgi:hypothetical protein